MSGSGIGDPFAVVNNPSPTAQPGSGALGQNADFFRNLMTFGAAMAQGANARTPGGFLANGPGWEGPMAAGILGAEQGARQNAALNSQIGVQQAQRGLLGAQTGVEQFQIPFAMMKLRAMQDYLQGAPGGGGPLPLGPLPQSYGGAAPGSPLPQRISAAESGGNPAAVNSQGFAGQYQVGVGALADAGLYTPAKGEDLSKNLWQGTINVPGFQPMDQKQFLANPQAQSAAFGAVTQHLTGEIPALGLDKFVGQTVDGVPITQDSLIRGMYFAGPQGMKNFLQSGGQFNPQDQQGTTLTGYLGRTGGPAPAGNGTPPSQDLMTQYSQGLARAQALRNQAAAISWVNPTIAASLNEQANNIEKYVYTSLQPQRNYPGGWSMAGGQVIRSGIPTEITNPDGSKTKAVEFPPIVDQSGTLLPGYVEPLQLNGMPPPGRSVPGATAGAPPVAAAPGIQPGTPPTGAQPHAALAPLPLPPGAPPAGGGPPGTATAAISPAQTEFLHERGQGLGEQFHGIDLAAQNAMNSNYLFDNMRRDSQTWQMGKFASWKNDALAYVQSIATSLGVPKPELAGLNRSLSDFQSFNKSAGMLLRQAVHETSSRAAVQEYRMIGSTLPTPENTAQAFSQIADQWQALNDYNIAKQKFSRGFLNNPEQMDPEWNKNVSPTAFLINRMMLTPNGQQDFLSASARMGQTPEGRSLLKGMMKEYFYAKQAGLFQGLDYSGAAPQGTGVGTPEASAAPASAGTPSVSPAAAGGTP
jgi:hypothetical protein